MEILEILEQTTIHPGAFWLDQPKHNLAGGEEENLLMRIVQLPSLDQNYLQSNQNKKERDYYACTYYSACGAIADLMNLTQSEYDKLIDDVITEALRVGAYTLGVGAYTSKSVEIACEVWNKWNKQQLTTRRCRVGSSLFFSLLARNYDMVMTYRHTSSYAEDAKDGHLDGTDFEGKAYGHCVRWANCERQTGKYKPKKPIEATVLDNYLEGDKYRRYTIKTGQVPFLTGQSPYYDYAYFFVDPNLLH